MELKHLPSVQTLKFIQKRIPEARVVSKDSSILMWVLRVLTFWDRNFWEKTMVVGNTIYLPEAYVLLDVRSVLLHEYIHMCDKRKLGFFKFVWLYLFPQSVGISFVLAAILSSVAGALSPIASPIMGGSICLALVSIWFFSPKTGMSAFRSLIELRANVSNVLSSYYKSRDPTISNMRVIINNRMHSIHSMNYFMSPESISPHHEELLEFLKLHIMRVPIRPKTLLAGGLGLEIECLEEVANELRRQAYDHRNR